MPYRVVVPDAAYFDRNIPCQTACPIHTECGRYVQAIGESKDELAYLLARAPNPFAYVLGRVCAHPCEDACRRGAIDRPIAICALKRFATDHHNLGLGHDPARKGAAPPAKRDKKIAVVGAGPCGLTAAHDLALLGYTVEVFESAPVPGGMLYLGIPHYRLPREIVKMEVDHILSLGVTLHTRATLGRDFTLAELRSRFDSVLLATGLNKGRELRIPGVHLDGVLQGVDFLLNANLGYQVQLGQKVVVVGGGNVAVDVARSAMRLLQEPEAQAQTVQPELESLEARESQGFMPAFDAARLALRAGAHEVRMISLEARHEMPAWASEVHDAQEEGIVLDNGWGPLEILGENGKVSGLKVRRCVAVYDEARRFNPVFTDEQRVIPCETVVLAIGQQADLSFLGRSLLQIDEELATSAPGVFAGGDVAFGPRILVEAVANGHRAARSIHTYLQGTARTKVLRRFRVFKDWRMPQGYLRVPRQSMPVLPTKRRIGIAEVELGFDEAQGRLEAKRCLKCQVNTVFDGSKCILCNGCVDICPEHCLRLVDLVQVRGHEAYERLIEERYGRRPEDLAAGQAGAIIKDEQKCIRCGLCAQRCPTGAVTMEALESEEREVFG
jgi:formate dehydrogenase beta subunit